MCVEFDLFFKGRNKFKAFYKNVFREILGCNGHEVINTVQRVPCETYLPGQYKSPGVVKNASFSTVRYTWLIIILRDPENPYTVRVRNTGIFEDRGDGGNNISYGNSL
jgi:hypothetical protein